MKVASFFSGAGGMDLGFERAGFEVVYANEIDKKIVPTYNHNHSISIDCRDIQKVQLNEIPDVDGFIGGPPCQSWSAAGKQRGIEDPRGQLFVEYIRLIDGKKPIFFVCENVPGILFKKNEEAFNFFLQGFKEAGYKLTYKKMNAKDYGSAQDRERVIIIGIRSDLDIEPNLNIKKNDTLCFRDAIGDLENSAVIGNNNKHRTDLLVLNHEYAEGGFSSIYMSRNRVRAWDEKAFTVQASGRQCQLHPSAPKMEKVGKDKFRFAQGYEDKYRRLTIRECARLQGFPDDFEFLYDNLEYGYKMVGNAVPVSLAEAVAKHIKYLLNKK